MRAHISADEFVTELAYDACGPSPDDVVRQRDDWQRACRLWIEAHRDDQRESEARAVIYFIATARREESSSNTKWQLDDWQKRCQDWLGR